MSQQKFLLKRLANISFLSKIRIICYKMQFSLRFSTQEFWLETWVLKKVIFLKKKSFFGNFFEGVNVLCLSVPKQIRLFILFSNLVNIVCHACLDFIQSLLLSCTTALLDVNGFTSAFQRCQNASLNCLCAVSGAFCIFI
jgi:hypothetical protein